MFLQRECLSPFSQNGRIRKPKRREKETNDPSTTKPKKIPYSQKPTFMKKFFLLMLSVFAFCAADAQVTTSGMNGTVTDADGQPLAGATVIAVHTPSGTQYGAVSDKNGGYNLQGLAHGRSLHGDLLVRGLPERRIPGTDAVAGPDPQARRFPQGQPAARSRGHHGRRQEQFDERQPRRGGHQHLQRADRTDAYGQPQHERHHAPHAAGLVDHLGTGHRRRQLPPVVRDGRRRGVQQHVRHRRQPARRRFAHFARRAGARCRCR